MNISKQDIVRTIAERPVEVGRWVGFSDLTDLHNKWLRDFLFRSDDQTLQAHRGSYKTTTLSIFLALHAILRPNESVLYFRKTGSDVAEVSRQVINILSSGCLRHIVYSVYGADLKLLKASGTEIHTNLATAIRGSSQIVGLGIGTSITGKHADIVVTDDIVNINDRISRAERDRTKIAYQELQNIKNRGGRFINTGTPWHKEDAFTLMPEADKYDCYETGLISTGEINSIKKKMLPSLFAANYELRHIASEDVIFEDPVTGADVANIYQAKYCHVDAAYNGEDYTAFTICNKKDGKYYVLGKMWRKHVDDVEDEIIALIHKYAVGRLYCEENSDRGYLAKELRRKGERVVTYWEDTNKFLKITSYLKGEWENVIFVNGTDEDYIQQVLDFNEDAEHDDAPDSLASIVRLLWKRKSGAEDKYIPLSERRII